VITDPLSTWHYHGEFPDEWPTFPEEAGNAAGKGLPRECIMTPGRAKKHIHKEHKEVNRDDVHCHPPREAKYVLFGKGKRLDIHPLALERLPDADTVFFVIEGTPKTDAILSAGEVAFGVPSVTMWPRRETDWFAGNYLRNKTVFVVPDADWAENDAVAWQALKLRTHIRAAGVKHCFVSAPSLDLGIKGVDDYLAARHKLGDLAIMGAEPDYARIREAVRGVDGRSRRTLARVLELLSLVADPDGVVRMSLDSFRGLVYIEDVDRALRTLDALAHTYTIVDGSLAVEQRTIRYRNDKKELEEMTQTKFEQTPSLALHKHFRAAKNGMPVTVTDIVNQLDEHDRRITTLELMIGQKVCGDG
jgi:hypothetical protein